MDVINDIILMTIVIMNLVESIPFQILEIHPQIIDAINHTNPHINFVIFKFLTFNQIDILLAIIN